MSTSKELTQDQFIDKVSKVYKTAFKQSLDEIKADVKVDKKILEDLAKKYAKMLTKGNKRARERYLLSAKTYFEELLLNKCDKFIPILDFTLRKSMELFVLWAFKVPVDIPPLLT